MAKAVAEGAKVDNNVQVELSFHVESEDLSKFDAIAIGAPTYYHEMPIYFKSLFEEVAMKGVDLKGKVGASFGSYGWSGEAPGLILEIMKNKFEMQTIEPPLIAKYIPDVKTLGACKDLGKKISETLISKGLH